MKKALERTLQKAGEKLGNTEKTEYNEELKKQLTMTETGEKELLKVCSNIECLMQPNANKRVGNAMYDKINKRIERISPYQDFGQCLKDFGDAMGKNDAFFNAITKLGVNEKLIGLGENDLCENITKSFYYPMKDFIHQDYKRMHEDKELLEKKRIDLEIIKGKFRKATSGTPQYDKMAADSETALDEFKQHEDRLLKVVNEINKKLLTHKSMFLELIEHQMKFHIKSLEQLNESKEDIQKVPVN